MQEDAIEDEVYILRFIWHEKRVKNYFDNWARIRMR
jgi:hypothetical protein